MEITYKSSRKEIWNFYWSQWLHGNLKWVHLRIFILVSLTIYFYNTKSLVWSFPVFITATICGIFSIIWLPIFPQIKFKPQIRRLTINENGITTSIRNVRGECTWKEIASIIQSNGNIYIIGIGGNGFVVPLRAFSSVQEKKEFLDLCLQYRAALKNTN